MTYVVEHPDFDIASFNDGVVVAMMLIADGPARPHKFVPGVLDAVWRLDGDVAFLDCLWHSVPEHTASFRFHPRDEAGDYAAALAFLGDRFAAGANVSVLMYPDASERRAAHRAFESGDKQMFVALAIGVETTLDCTGLQALTARCSPTR